MDLPVVGAAGLAKLIEQNHAELMARECRMLEVACAWADAHYLDSGSEDYQPLLRRACAWGGEGTPEVSEYCAAELGTLQGTGIAAARMLIADALDLRYRLPRLWGRVLTGGVRAWQARKIAEQTRRLSWEACADVDHALSDFVGMMPWPRFATILAAAILGADPALANQQAERAKAAQDVFALDSEDGLKTIVAKASAGDVVWFLATVNRIAEILTSCGDTDPLGARRAKAVGILARPAEALRLLIDNQHNPPTRRASPPSLTPHPSLNLAGRPSRDPPPSWSRIPKSMIIVAGSDDAAGLGCDGGAAGSFCTSTSPTRQCGSDNGVVRPEHGDPTTLDELVEFLGPCRMPVRTSSRCWIRPRGADRRL